VTAGCERGRGVTADTSLMALVLVDATTAYYRIRWQMTKENINQNNRSLNHFSEL